MYPDYSSGIILSCPEKYFKKSEVIMNTIPNEIISAVNTLLKPYGTCFDPSPEKPKTIKKFLNMKEAAEYSGLKKWTLQRRIKAGELKASKLFQSRRGTVLIAVKDLDDYINRHVQ